MTTFLLEAFNTDSRFRDDVRYRDYTTSPRIAEAFGRIPKIQFSDSGHGIVFSTRALERGTRRLPKIYALDDYVREHLHVEKPERAKKPTYHDGFAKGFDDGVRMLARHIYEGGGVSEFLRQHGIVEPMPEIVR